MKKLFTLLVLSLFLFGCGSNESRAKKAVTKFLKTELDDFGRYESVSWGKLDSVINVLDNDPYYKELKNTISFYEQRISDLENTTNWGSPLQIAENEGLKAGAEARLEQERKRLDTYTSNYQPGFVGWEIEHTYRTPNKLGALELETDTFFIEPDFSEADYKAVPLL